MRGCRLRITPRDSPRGVKFHENKFVVSDFTFEIVIRVLKHITGPGEPSEHGQKDQPQHRSPLRLKKKKKGLLCLVVQRKRLGCRSRPRQRPLQRRSYEPRMRARPARTNVDDESTEEEQGEGGGEDIRAGRRQDLSKSPCGNLSLVQSTSHSAPRSQ